MKGCDVVFFELLVGVFKRVQLNLNISSKK